MINPNLIFHDSAEELAERLADLVEAALKLQLSTQGKGLLILPGGSSPRELIKELSHRSINWNDVTVTTTDERAVPLEGEGSNAGQIERLSGLDVFWLENAETNIKDLPWPSAVTVLGMGEDAHIASLFPDSEIDMAAKGLVSAEAPFEPRERISLTMQSLLETKRLILLVIGRKKWTICERILEGELQDTPLAKLMDLAGDRLSLHIVDN